MKLPKQLPHIHTFTGTDIALRRQLERLKIVIIIIAVVSLLAIGGCTAKSAEPTDTKDKYNVNGCIINSTILDGYRVFASINCHLAVQ